MYRKIITLFCLLLTLNNPLLAQKNTIEDGYVKYFENTREVPFLHINKTKFLKGEEVWFQAYVLEQNSKKLHPTTSNLYVGLFDQSGALLQQKLIHVKQGIGQGSIYLDSTFTKENYYIKASTNWMRNFKEDNSFVQKIKVVNNVKSKKNISPSKSYDFQVFPEV